MTSEQAANWARAIVISQSLEDGRLPASLNDLAVEAYPHRLGGVYPVNIVVLRVPASDAWRLALELSRLLKAERYYAHVVCGDDLFVAFPHCVCVVPRSNAAERAAQARSIGVLFGVPPSEMQFESLFDVDHPDDIS